MSCNSLQNLTEFVSSNISGSSNARRGDRMAGLMAASNDSSPSPRHSPRPNPRERFAGLLSGGGDSAVNQTHPPPRERMAAVFGGGASSGDSGKNWKFNLKCLLQADTTPHILKCRLIFLKNANNYTQLTNSHEV